jgi:methane/ammonia monooxygenase subunit A
MGSVPGVFLAPGINPAKTKNTSAKTLLEDSQVTENDAAVLSAAGMSRQAAIWSRKFDILVIIVAAFFVASVVYINFLLFAGDWDFFIDFKDREYWVVIYPIVQIMMVAAFQAIFWNLFRLPVGATACAVMMTLLVWLERYQSWGGLSYFPITLVAPSTFFAGALILDGMLCVTRSFLVTGLFGGALFGLTFYPSNWAFFAPYFQPVKLMDSVVPLASMIGYEFARTGTPEYVRLIERGTLRTFGSPVWVSVFFSTFVCILQYLFWWLVGALAAKAAFIPVGYRFKQLYGTNDTRPSAETSSVGLNAKTTGGVA